MTGATGPTGAAGGAGAVVYYAGDGSVDNAIFGSGTQAVPRDNAGNPIKVDFAALFAAAGKAWVPGTIVTATYFVNCQAQASPPGPVAVKMYTWIRMSIDGGSTWVEMDPSAGLAVSSNGVQETGQNNATTGGWCAVSCSLPPLIEIACSVYTPIYVPFDDLSCSLNCAAIPAAQWLGAVTGTI